MARITENPGNSCVHVTDDQTEAVGLRGGESRKGGMACDASYAFVCSKVLLDERSWVLINSAKWGELGELGGKEWREKWGEYERWLESGEMGSFPNVDL